MALGFSETGIHFDPVLTSSTTIITQGVWIQHPSFVNPPTRPFPFATPANHPDRFDLAVFVMDQPVDLRPARLPALNSLSALAGEDPRFSAVGFGVAINGQLQTSGVRRSTTERLVDVFDAYILLAPEPGLPCGRDSGGPNFIGGSGHSGKKPFVSEVDATVHNVDCSSFVLAYRLDTPQAQSFLGQFVDLENDE